jgi:hypothetical protein
MDGTEPHDAVLLVYPGGTAMSRVAQSIDQQSVNTKDPLLSQRRRRRYPAQFV